MANVEVGGQFPSQPVVTPGIMGTTNFFFCFQMESAKSDRHCPPWTCFVEDEAGREHDRWDCDDDPWLSIFSRIVWAEILGPFSLSIPLNFPF